MSDAQAIEGLRRAVLLLAMEVGKMRIDPVPRTYGETMEWFEEIAGLVEGSDRVVAGNGSTRVTPSDSGRTGRGSDEAGR